MGGRGGASVASFYPGRERATVASYSGGTDQFGNDVTFEVQPDRANNMSASLINGGNLEYSIALNIDGERRGSVRMRIRPDGTAQIYQATVPGYGVRTYAAAMAFARSKGVTTIQSDKSVSEGASRVWQSMSRRTGGRLTTATHTRQGEQLVTQGREPLHTLNIGGVSATRFRDIAKTAERSKR